MGDERGGEVVNPRALAALRRWRDCLLAAGLAAAATAAFAPAALTGAVAPAALLALSLLVAGALFRDGWLRARLAGPAAAGLVAVKEGRIGYLGPIAGGLADLDSIVSVEVERRGGETVWVLRLAEGPSLAIPATAEGADRLLDAFAALPAFDTGRVARALDAPEGVRVLVWRRRSPPTALASRRPPA
jgi:hypothetical protein